MLDDFGSPDADQQKHGGKFNFPEEKEEQKIEREENAHDAGFQNEHQGHIFLDTHLFPATNHRQHGEQSIEDNQRQAQAINTQEIVDIELYGTSLETDPGQVYRVWEMVEVTKVIAI